jgi:hypothetical protein
MVGANPASSLRARLRGGQSTWARPSVGSSTRRQRRTPWLLAMLTAVFLLASTGTAWSQSCPFSPYVDCGGGSCCPGADTCCGTDPQGCCKPGAVCGTDGCVATGTGSGTCPSGFPINCNDGTCCPSGTVCDNGTCPSASSNPTGPVGGSSLCPNGQRCGGTDICCGDNMCRAAGSSCCGDATHGYTACAAGDTCCGFYCVSPGFFCCGTTKAQGCLNGQTCCGGSCCAGGDSCDSADQCSSPPAATKSGCNSSSSPAGPESFLFLFGVLTVASGWYRRAKRNGEPRRQ